MTKDIKGAQANTAYKTGFIPKPRDTWNNRTDDIEDAQSNSRNKVSQLVNHRPQDPSEF